MMRAGRFRAAARDAQSAPFERAPGNLGVGGSIPVGGARTGSFHSVSGRSRLEWEAERRGGSRGVRGGVDVIPKDVEEEGEGERDGEGAEEASVAARDGGGVRDDGPSDGERDAGDDDDERATGPAREDALERAPTLAGVSPEGGRVVDGQAPRAPERGAVRAGGELGDVQRQTAALKRVRGRGRGWRRRRGARVSVRSADGATETRSASVERSGGRDDEARRHPRSRARRTQQSRVSTSETPLRKSSRGAVDGAPAPTLADAIPACARAIGSDEGADQLEDGLAGDPSSSDARRVVPYAIVEKSNSNAKRRVDGKTHQAHAILEIQTCPRRYLRVGSSASSLASSRRRRESVAFAPVELVSDLVASSHRRSLLAKVAIVLLLHL
jgi:hypothetical protein